MTSHSAVGRLTWGVLVLLASTALAPAPVQAVDREYPVRGMVVEVNRVQKSIVVSHDDIPGFMSSMTMPFDVRADESLETIVPGSLVTFTLVVGDAGAHATRVMLRGYDPVSQDPRARTAAGPSRDAATGVMLGAVPVGASVPGFTLTSQAGRPVTLADFAGKVVVLNFVYTHCTLTQFCPRMARHFVDLQRRLVDELGKGVVLVTVTIDPVRDTPEALAGYAASLDATSPSWYFLTGREADVRRVGRLFGVDHLPDAVNANHTVRIAVISRKGLLAARVEGNAFDAQQLGDLVLAVMNDPS